MKKTFKPLLIASAMAAVMTAGVANAWTTVSPAPLTNGTPVTQSVSNASFSDPNFGYQAWAMFGKWSTFTAVAGQQVTITVMANPAAPDFHPAVSVWKRPIGTAEAPYKYKGGQVTNLTPAMYVPDHNFNATQSYINSAATQQHVMETGSGKACVATPEVPCVTQTRTIKDSGGVDHVITAERTQFWKAATRDAPANGATGVLLEDGNTDIGLPRMIRAASFADGDGAPAMMNKLNSDPNLKVVKDGVSGKVTAYFVPNESVQYQVFVGGWNPGPGVAGGNKNVDVTIMGAAN